MSVIDYVELTRYQAIQIQTVHILYLVSSTYLEINRRTHKAHTI